MTCDLSRYDGAYVLGALSPADRRLFEEHLPTCPACRRSVGQLAGLPGLLARVSPETLAEDPDAPGDPPVPPTVLPELLRRVRRDRRRRTLAVAVGAAAAVLVVVVGSFLVLHPLGDDASEGNPPAARQSQPADRTEEPDARPTEGPQEGPTLGPPRSMTPVADIPMTASLRVTPVAWGTRLDLQCSYGTPKPGAGGYGQDGPQGQDGQSGPYGDPTDGQTDGPRTWPLVLVVSTRDGSTEQVASWRAAVDQDMKLTASTAIRREDIQQIEVRTRSGTPVMRLGS